MTQANSTGLATRWLRIALAALLVAALAGGVYVVWPSRGGNKVVGVLPSAVGLYPGDDVRVVGVPVGTIDSIEPRATDVKVTMTVHDDVKLPADAQARSSSRRTWCRPGSFSSPPPTPAGPRWPTAPRIGLDRTGVPVEWDEVKEQLTQLQHPARTAAGLAAGPAESRSSTRPPTRSTATATRSARRCANCRRPQAGSVIRAPICSAPCATCRCWSTRCPTATSRSCSSPTTSPRCRRCWPTARTDLDNTLGTLNQALERRQGLPQREQRGADRPGRQARRLHQDPHRSQRRHRAGPAHHAQRPGELLQHLQPRAGHRRRPAVAAQLRQPGAVHLRRHLRHRRQPGQLQARRDLPPADGPGVASASR